MANASVPLAQSETKALFLQRLGLDTERANDKAMYQLMKAEVLAEREYLHADRKNLLPHIRDDPTIRGPYSHSQITETALHRATIRIYENASPATRRYYDLGRYTLAVEENWIIRWLLWHVFRYRDRRRLNKRRASGDGASIDTSRPESSAAAQVEQADGVRPSTQTMSEASTPTSTGPDVAFAPTSAPTRKPFDPVRDI